MSSAETKHVPSVYMKLQQMRVELQNAGIKKSGNNDYSHYTYHELKDFLPTVNELSVKYRIFNRYEMSDNAASLHIIDCESGDSIEFKIPLADLSIKGASGIQNVGGITTYSRRYLYMIAYEISENDELDYFGGKEKGNRSQRQSGPQYYHEPQPQEYYEPDYYNQVPPQAPQEPAPAEPDPQVEAEKMKQQKVAPKYVEILRGIMARKGVTEEQVIGRYRKEKIEDLTMYEYFRAVSGLNSTPDKRAEQVNLGL